MRCTAGVAGGDSTEVRQGREVKNPYSSQTSLERGAKDGDSPVDKRVMDFLGLFPKYHGTRGILWESGRTTS